MSDVDVLADLVDLGYPASAEEIAVHLLANRGAVLRALGLHEEHAIDKPGMRGINPQRRFVTDWEADDE